MENADLPMVEKVVLALQAELDRLGIFLSDEGEIQTEDPMPKLARAAIAAMREPTREMWRAAADENGYVTGAAWQSMIDAALSTPEAE